MEGLDQAAQFSEGHELGDASKALVPPDAIGRMLSLEEAGKIIRKLEIAPIRGLCQIGGDGASARRK